MDTVLWYLQSRDKQVDKRLKSSQIGSLLQEETLEIGQTERSGHSVPSLSSFLLSALSPSFLSIFCFSLCISTDCQDLLIWEYRGEYQGMCRGTTGACGLLGAQELGSWIA